MTSEIYFGIGIIFSLIIFLICMALHYYDVKHTDNETKFIESLGAGITCSFLFIILWPVITIFFIVSLILILFENHK